MSKPSLIKEWNPKQAALKEAISKPKRFGDAMSMCLDLHGLVHSSAVSGADAPTILDSLWNGLSEEAFRAPPAANNGFGHRATIAWNVWHITRIEDITANILMSDGAQVLDDDRLRELGVTTRDTGNAMTCDEIADFSRGLGMDALHAYREAVGVRTREIISKFLASDMKRKMNPESVRRILTEGGVVDHQDSIWLLDFWGGKTVAGILLMPITRHQIMHLSDCAKLKEKFAGGKKSNGSNG